ncbi:MAG: glycosyltransferase family 4 protein [Pseudomonadota bacterium]
MKKIDQSLKCILIIGGPGLSLINFRFYLLEAFVKEGYEVHAIGSDEKGVREKLNSIAVTFHPVDLNRQSISIINSLVYALTLYRLIKEIRPNVCILYTIKPVIYGSLAAFFAGVKDKHALITGLGYAFIATGLKATLIKTIVCLLYKLALSFCQCVIFQNKDDRDYFCQLKLVNRAKTSVVNGSGVDLSYFTPAPYPVKITFLMIARFLPEKGIFEYVEACRRLKAQYPKIRCCLVGYQDSCLANITKETIQSWGSAGIENLGKQIDVRDALQESSVYVLPSYREGTPRSVLEAMAMKRPIITTDTPGCRQTVEHGKNGFLVPIKNSEALYQVMLSFVRNPSMIASMGAESLSIVRERFDVHKVNQVMLKIMQF